MPWKNGQGTTLEISIYPNGSAVSEMNFLWRLSSATILSSGSFSSFPGYTRWITPIRGHPMKLYHKNCTGVDDSVFLNLLDTHCFPGSVETRCEVVSETVDFNVITKDSRYRAFLKTYSIEKQNNTLPIRHLVTRGNLCFVFCISGNFEVRTLEEKSSHSSMFSCICLSEGQIVRVESPSKAKTSTHKQQNDKCSTTLEITVLNSEAGIAFLIVDIIEIE